MPRCSCPDVEGCPGMFLHAGQLRTRLILRHLLRAREPQRSTNIKQALLQWNSRRGASGMLEFPAGKCPDRQTRVKNGRVLPQTRPSSARSFCHGSRLWCENFIDELVFESKAQRLGGKSHHQLARSCGMGSCGIGLWKIEDSP